MGYMVYHAIVVSSEHRALPGFDPTHSIEEAHVKAREIFGAVESIHCDHARAVGPILEHPINGGGTFIVAPDGSKEGWSDSDKGDAARAAFVEWLRSTEGEDGSRWLRWVEIEYGDDDHAPEKVTAGPSTPTPEAGR